MKDRVRSKPKELKKKKPHLQNQPKNKRYVEQPVDDEAEVSNEPQFVDQQWQNQSHDNQAQEFPDEKDQQQLNEQHADNLMNQDQNLSDALLENQKNLEQYQQQQSNRGVIYMSRIPPYMTPNYIRKLLKSYDVERIYLLPESEWVRNNRIKHGGSKRICFREGWIEFGDKKVAKMVALSLNGQKMVHKKGSFYSEDVWNIKYLPKFKWHNLTERLAHQQRLKKQRLRLEMDQERKTQQYYSNQVTKSKTIGGIVKNKMAKGRELKKANFRKYNQTSAIEDNQQ